MSDEERQSVDAEVYEKARREIESQLQTANNEIDAHEIVVQELHDRFDHYSWVGVYVVESDELVLSAWAGPEETEHTRIPIGEGICGLAAKTGETEVVPDVSEREEFIACFPSTRAEIVVPIHGADGVVGEIDVDSDWEDAFDERDRELLETVAAKVAKVMEAGGA
ncbi:MAG: GAF domain-containing protein [Gemmatimonadota bacterium]|nr:GAF domain-containing protein [Gemmatimonadota bacterium]